MQHAEKKGKQDAIFWGREMADEEEEGERLFMKKNKLKRFYVKQTQRILLLVFMLLLCLAAWLKNGLRSASIEKYFNASTVQTFLSVARLEFVAIPFKRTYRKYIEKTSYSTFKCV